MFDYLLNNWISILALIISGWLLYHDYLMPFRPSIRAIGRVTISKNPLFGGLQQDCIHVDIVFSNQGAKRGAIEDVAIEINLGQNSSLFRSIAVMQNRNLPLGNELIPPTLESFVGFELGKSESVVKRILFVPHSGSASFSLKENNYRGTIWVRHSSARKWIKYTDFEFNVDKDDLSELSKSTMVLQPDGRYYISWITRDKVLSSTEDHLLELSKYLVKKKH